ncbi:B-cell receptor CD22-like [Cheilinus undulatus]|uniref:B-cell receptor CD22-like n=1 Tax=Cheilinus undulatus TaxID=241271 RepID=UPI001BD570B3|nr:B-cell receptor CD22-like [Cheilinus undulatus]
MSSTMKTLILLILVTLPGVWSGDWDVTFTDQCALKGSSVVIRCKYDYPWHHLVTSTGWYKAVRKSGRLVLVPLSEISSDPNHFIYVGDKSSDCSLKINNVQHSDIGGYYFHFKTTLNKWTSQRPAVLTVGELTAAVQPSTVTEGDSVRLTCWSGCPTPVEKVWFREGRHVSNSVFQARRTDAGRYYCGVLRQNTVRSASVVLNVQYAPRGVSLSVNPSSMVVKGRSVTLTCRSEANPPVGYSGYRLYKDGRLISSGPTYTISDVQPSHSGLFWCQAWNNIRRDGISLINSSQVHLDVLYPPMNISVTMDPPHVSEGGNVNMTCSCSANPAAESYTWFRRTASPSSTSSMLQVGSGQVLSLLSVETSHTGLYLCRVRNKMGENNSTEMLLTMTAADHGTQSILALAGVGFLLLLMLLLAVFLFWRKKTKYEEKKDRIVSSRSNSSTVAEDPVDSVYMNIGALSSFPLPVNDQDFSPHSKAQASVEDDVTYSVVTIKPKNSAPSHRMNNNRATRECRLEAGENEDSVIYSTLAKPS